jgi:hypothetical protein
MIKIIKNTMEDPIECTCPTCSSVISYNYQDLKREETRNLFGYPTGYNIYIICPVCKATIMTPRPSNDRNPKIIFDDEEEES